jgi:hypothetical protein
LEALRKTIKTLQVAYVTAEAVTGHPPNTNQKPVYSVAEKKHCMQTYLKMEWKEHVS